MRRRNLSVEEEHINHDRWLVSYSDFITLLFAFFVVMYSLSKLTDAEFVQVSEKLRERFANSTHIRNELDPADIGPTATQTTLEGTDFASEAGNVELTPAEIDDTPARTSGLPKPLQVLKDRLEHALQETVNQGQLGLFGNEQWLEVEMNSEVLFSQGSAALNANGQLLIQYLAEQLKTLPNAIRVEGFTDNSPLTNATFRSNWALSSARAASVAEVLQRYGVAPERLAAIGYGAYQPITSNSSQLGRAVNRRISLLISEDSSPRPGRAVLRPDVGEEVTAPVQASAYRNWVEEVAEALERANQNDTKPLPDRTDQGVNIIRKQDGGLLFTNENE